MELTLYVGVVLLAVALTPTSSPLSARPLFQFLVVVGFACFSIVVRSTGFDADIAAYAQRMASTDLSFYYLREPVVWLGHRLLFAMTQSHVATFVISDVLCFVILTRAFRRLGLPLYALVAVIAFFPFVMGMQNIYRQWVAGCLALYALSLSDRHFGRALLVVGLAAASHNAAALFLPLVFSRARPSISVPMTMLGIVAAPPILLFSAATKSSASTGLGLEILYLLLILAIGIVTLHPTRGSWKRWVALSVFYSIYLAGWSVFILSSSGSERISLFSLILLYPAIVESFEINYKNQLLIRSAFAASGFIPILFSGVKYLIY